MFVARPSRMRNDIAEPLSFLHRCPCACGRSFFLHRLLERRLVSEGTLKQAQKVRLQFPHVCALLVIMFHHPPIEHAQRLVHVSSTLSQCNDCWKCLYYTLNTCKQKSVSSKHKQSCFSEWTKQAHYLYDSFSHSLQLEQIYSSSCVIVTSLSPTQTWWCHAMHSWQHTHCNLESSHKLAAQKEASHGWSTEK